MPEPGDRNEELMWLGFVFVVMAITFVPTDLPVPSKQSLAGPDATRR
jgi:hypothetical protein